MSGEIVEGVIRLGNVRIAVAYPAALDAWFDGVVERAQDEAEAPCGWVRLSEGDAHDRFDVASSGGASQAGVALGRALATFWERASFLLIDGVQDAIALHAAVVRRDDAFVLVCGRSGAGKTRLALWYRLQGFDLGSDEVVAVSAALPIGGSDARTATFAGALARPAILKSPMDLAPCLKPGELPLAQCEAEAGLLLRLASARWSAGESTAGAVGSPIARGLIVFPHFVPGAPLRLTALGAGEAGLRLTGSCLNVRNLPAGGLPIVGALARGVAAVAIEYGDTAQLAGTLDVLTRQVHAARPGPADLAALCDAFTARAAARESSAAASPASLAPTVARFPRRLTIGMATYDDYDGVYFTVQSLRMGHPELAGDLELVVVDNHPGGPASAALSELARRIDGVRYVPRGDRTGTSVRNAVFEEASSPLVLCIDCHVLVAPGALAKLVAFDDANPGSRDLLQGPMLHDDLTRLATHMEPRWHAGMLGVWEADPRGVDPDAPAFEIPLQGLGLFACRRAAWVGFSELFRGFGGEEGYLHEKVRRYGGRTLCLPFLRWLHRFDRPRGVPYAMRWEDRIRNYLIGFSELGIDTSEVEAHFADVLGAEATAAITSRVKDELGIDPDPVRPPSRTAHD